jgi:hypothetical protein
MVLMTPNVLTWHRWKRKVNLRGAHFSFVLPLVSPFQLKTKHSKEESGLFDPCNQQLFCLERPASSTKL